MKENIWTEGYGSGWGTLDKTQNMDGLEDQVLGRYIKVDGQSTMAGAGSPNHQDAVA